VDTNKIVAAIYAVNAEPARMSNAAAFLLRYDEMLATLNSRDEARNIAMKDVLLPEPPNET
jgi:hypothetical protein